MMHDLYSENKELKRQDNIKSDDSIISAFYSLNIPTLTSIGQEYKNIYNKNILPTVYIRHFCAFLYKQYTVYASMWINVYICTTFYTF